MENKFSVNENHICIYGDQPPIEAGLKEATLRRQKRVAIEYDKEPLVFETDIMLKYPILKELLIHTNYPSKQAKELLLTPLGALNLTELDITDCDNPVIDFSGFKSLKKLLFYFNKRRTTNLSKLVNLEWLQMRDYKNYPDFEVLRSLSSLRELEIWDTHVESLEGIQGCTSLERIVLARPRKLKDISALTALPNLKKIDISGALVLEDYSPIARIPSLESFIAENNKIPIHVSDLIPNHTIKFFQIKRLASLEGIENMTALNYALFEELETKDVSPMFLSKSLIGTHFLGQKKMNYTVQQVEEKLQQNNPKL